MSCPVCYESFDGIDTIGRKLQCGGKNIHTLLLLLLLLLIL